MTSIIVLILLFLTLIYPNVLRADSGNDNYYPSMMGMMFGWNGSASWDLWGFIMMILFWLIIIFSAIVFFKWLANQNRSEDKKETALDILKKRYANGEIDKKEFEAKKKDLL